jgi:hypothetical protein
MIFTTTQNTKHLRRIKHVAGSNYVENWTQLELHIPFLSTLWGLTKKDE